MDLTAHRATETDLQAALNLVADSSAALSTERGGPLFVSREGVPEPAAEHLRRWLSDPKRCIAIGLADGVPLGLAVARLESLQDGDVLARLEFLWVDAGVREIGLGAELMEHVVDWANDNEASHLDAYALPGNRQAKNFLETSGFSARLIVMTRRLTGRASEDEPVAGDGGGVTA